MSAPIACDPSSWADEVCDIPVVTTESTARLVYENDVTGLRVYAEENVVMKDDREQIARIRFFCNPESVTTREDGMISAGTVIVTNIPTIEWHGLNAFRKVVVVPHYINVKRVGQDIHLTIMEDMKPCRLLFNIGFLLRRGGYSSLNRRWLTNPSHVVNDLGNDLFQTGRGKAKKPTQLANQRQIQAYLFIEDMIKVAPACEKYRGTYEMVPSHLLTMRDSLTMFERALAHGISVKPEGECAKLLHRMQTLLDHCVIYAGWRANECRGHIEQAVRLSNSESHQLMCRGNPWNDLTLLTAIANAQEADGVPIEPNHLRIVNASSARIVQQVKEEIATAAVDNPAE